MTPKQAFQVTVVVLLTLAGAYLLIRLRDLIIVAIIALIFAAAISPLVAIVNRRLPLAVSIGVVYLGVLLVFIALVAFIVQPLIGEARTLIENAPELLEDAQTRIADLQRSLNLPGNLLTPDLQGTFSRLTESAPGLAVGVLDVTLGFITGVGGIILALVVAFYWLLERNNIEGTWLGVLPRDKRAEARQMVEEIESGLGAYVRGQLTLAVIIGVMSYIGLTLLGIRFTLVLALIAGVSELVPLAGPIIGAIPAILIAITVSPLRALLVVGLYVVIQQVENHVLVPKVMQRAVGLSPLTVVFSIFAGAALLGIVGVLLAVPVVSAARIILNHTLLKPQQEAAAY